jgi:hypothetical protein
MNPTDNMKIRDIMRLRTCTVCGHTDFDDLLTKYSIRTYRHSDKWKLRCDWMKAHPNASLSDAKETRKPGVAYAL